MLERAGHFLQPLQRSLMKSQKSAGTQVIIIIFRLINLYTAFITVLSLAFQDYMEGSRQLFVLMEQNGHSAEVATTP
jgi:hypothetical protein